MTTLAKRATGRPSKGLRHPFTVKPGIDRAKKLNEALAILEVDGVTLLTPVIEAYIDSLDLNELQRRKDQEALFSSQKAS